MRRFLGLLLAAAMLAGCGPSAVPTQANTTPSPRPDETEAAVVFSVMERNTPEITYAPTPEPTPEPAHFDAVWIADTQVITSLYPETLDAMMQYAAQNRTAGNIRLVIHTGDIVYDFESRRQWTDVGEAFSMLGDLPFIAVCGNHDVGTNTLTYTRFGDYVASLYPDQSKLYQSGRGSYILIEEGGQKLLFAGIGWGYNDSAVEWLNEVIRAHPDCQCVLCLHSYLEADATLTDGGEIIFEKVVKPNPGVRLVLCGHRDGEARLDTPIDDNGDGITDRTVTQLMYNYQETLEREEGGSGYLRILRFYPGAGTLRVTTYSPTLEKFLTGPGQEFVIEGVFS